MPSRTHITELSFSLASQGVLILHPKDLDQFAEQPPEICELADDCHIYLITKRARLGFVPNSITSNNGIIQGRMYYRRLGQTIEVDFGLTGTLNGTINYSDYPHSAISIATPKGVAGPFPANLTSLICEEIGDRTLRDMEVVYVGMSYGDGTRSAKDRLKSHSTLQKVLADMSSEEPDSECMLILVQYAPPFAIISFDGRDKTIDPKNDRDPIEDLQRHKTLISGQTEIALAEAGLIKYFAPKYNEKYKNTFPQRAHSITESLYDIDFTGFTVELNTENIHVRLFSKERSAGHHHIAAFDLHDPTLRRSFFSLMESSSSYSADNISGPLY